MFGSYSTFIPATNFNMRTRNCQDMADFDMGENDETEISQTDLVQDVEAYFHRQGWHSKVHNVNPSTVLFANTRQSDSGTEYNLCMSMTEPTVEITPRHVKYLLSAGKEHGVSDLSIVTGTELTDTVQQAVNEYGIDIITPDELNRTPELNRSPSEIDFPTTPEHANTADGQSGNTESSDQPRRQNPTSDNTGMKQEQASPVEVSILVIGCLIALVGILQATYLTPSTGIGGGSNNKLFLMAIISIPTAFVGITALDDYFNWRLFGSWRAKKENVSGIVGLMIFLLLLIGAVGCRACGEGGFYVAATGAGILFLHSVTIHVINVFFEKRRGRR